MVDPGWKEPKILTRNSMASILSCGTYGLALMQSCLQYRQNTAVVVVMLRQGRIAAMKWNCISSARRKRPFTVFYKLKFITMYAGLLREYRVHRNSSKCTCIEVYCTTRSKTDKPLYNQLHIKVSIIIRIQGILRNWYSNCLACFLEHSNSRTQKSKIGKLIRSVACDKSKLSGIHECDIEYVRIPKQTIVQRCTSK